MEPLEGQEDLNRYGCSGKKHMNLNRLNLGEYGICIAHRYSFMHNFWLVLLPLLSLHFKKSPYLLFKFPKLHICLHPLSQVRDALQKCADFKHYLPGDHIGYAILSPMLVVTLVLVGCFLAPGFNYGQWEKKREQRPKLRIILRLDHLWLAIWDSPYFCSLKLIQLLHRQMHWMCLHQAIMVEQEPIP